MCSDKKKHEEEILSFIEKHGVERKDAGGSVRKKRPMTGSKGKRTAHRMVIDLHGLRSEEAEMRLRGALERCRNSGIRELLVVHGYGLHSDPSEGPVLKKLVRNLLDNALRKEYSMYRTAPLRDGGEGATLVSIR
jgi:DNA-nicking Smr family endonuclease